MATAECEHPSLEIVADEQSLRSYVRCLICQAEVFDFGAQTRRAYRAGGSRPRRPGNDFSSWGDPPVDRETRRQRAVERALELATTNESPAYVPASLLCPSCERNAITRNGRCDECQWAVN